MAEKRKPLTIAEVLNLNTNKTPQPTDYLRLHQLQAEEVPLSTSSIYAMMAKGLFPAPVPLTGMRGVAWSRGSIWAWKAEQEANGPAIRAAAKAKRDAAKAKRDAASGASIRTIPAGRRS